MIDTDVLVVGSGIAGLSLALDVAATAKVLVVTKKARDEANTRYAQGGISSVLAADDSFDRHVQDTLTAGAGLCHEGVVRLVVEEGPEAIAWLTGQGVNFDRGEDGEYDLGREGGHSRRRVLHSGDITGSEVIRALTQATEAHPNIELLEHHAAVDLITSVRHLRRGGPNVCHGAYVLDSRSGEVLTVRAKTTVLATGGAG